MQSLSTADSSFRLATSARAASVHPIPRTQLPVPASRRGGALVRATRAVSKTWILHRRLMVLLMAGVCVAGLGASIFYARGGIVQTGETLGKILSGQFAAAGIGIEEISLSGQALTSELMIAEALGIDPEATIFEFDAEAARARLMELPAVADVRIGKAYPSKLVVEITEFPAVARWRVDGVTFLIGATGDQLAIADPADTDLPLVIGDGAADDAALMIGVLDAHPLLKDGLVALSRIADRRWDFIYDTGLRIKMPEFGVAQALKLVEEQHAAHQLLDRDLTVIDLRVPGLLAVEVTERETE